MLTICSSLWSGRPDGWGAAGKRKTQGQTSSLPGPEQGLGSRPPASQRGIPRLRNTHKFSSPTSPVARAWCKIRAYCLQDPLAIMFQLPPGAPKIERQLCPSRPKGTMWAKGCSFPPPEAVTLVLGTPSSPSLPGTLLLPACLLSSRGPGSPTMLHPSCGRGTAKPPRPRCGCPYTPPGVVSPALP